MVRVIRDKILNHLVSSVPSSFFGCVEMSNLLKGAEEVPLVVVGNKSDLKPEQRQVSLDEGRQLAEEVNCAFTEASAFLDFNVSKAFDLMIGEIEKSQNPSQPTGGNKCVVM
jgi:Ras family protein